MHQLDFGYGSAQTAMGSLQRSPDALAGFKGLTSKGRERKGRRLCSLKISLEYALMHTLLSVAIYN